MARLYFSLLRICVARADLGAGFSESTGWAGPHGLYDPRGADILPAGVPSGPGTLPAQASALHRVRRIATFSTKDFVRYKDIDALRPEDV